MSRYLIASIVRGWLPTIERQVRVESGREAALVAAPHAHTSVWVALAYPLVDSHASPRPLVVAPKPLSARPPTPLT